MTNLIKRNEIASISGKTCIFSPTNIDMLETIGYLLAIFIGLSLGLVGSGGSILTVPLLVYCFGLDPIMATSYSLFIVGSASAVGAGMRLKQGQVHLRVVATFGSTSILTVFLIRRFVLPLIPETLFYLGDFAITQALIFMLAFATLISCSGIFVLRGPTKDNAREATSTSNSFLLLSGVGIGLITGFLGAGGGFLIVPILMLIFRLPIQVAAGTSMAIITVNTLLGWLGDLGQLSMDWSFLGIILGITLLGLLMGNILNRFINGKQLTKGFAYFLLLVATCIVSIEVIGLIRQLAFLSN